MGKLYLCPVVISPWYSYFFATNLLYNTAWIFTWDREQIVAASVLLFLIAQTNIISLGIMARNIAYDNHQLREEKPKIYWYENVKKYLKIREKMCILSPGNHSGPEIFEKVQARKTCEIK